MRLNVFSLGFVDTITHILFGILAHLIHKVLMDHQNIKYTRLTQFFASWL